MFLPVVTSSLSYEPETALFQLDSLKMRLQVASYAYLSNIHYSNDFLKDSHSLLVHYITGIFKDHSVHPIALTYL